LPYAIDYVLSELITSSDHDCALPCAVDYALSGLSGLGVCGTFIPQGVVDVVLRSILMSFISYIFLSLKHPSWLKNSSL
jgi:hypothetical protein